MVSDKVANVALPIKYQILKVRLSNKRLNQRSVYPLIHEKSMTQVIEELIDSLPNPKLQSPYKGEALDPVLR